MDECCLVAAVVLIGGGLVTLVGHGLWVLLRAMFGRRPAGAIHSPDERGLRACPSCGWQSNLAICPQCRRLLSHAALRMEFVEAHRTFERLFQMGIIDQGVLQTMLATLDRRYKELQAAGPEPAPARQPAPPQPAEPRTFADQFRPAPAAPAAPPPPPPMPAEHARQAIHEPTFIPPPMPSPPPTAPLPVPPAKRERLSEMFAAFMESRNIRWGELIGGMLILFCSIALVVSLWSQIAAVPVLKFFIFTAVTAAMFAVGLYTDHRWKLPTTSRGILIISMLLVPLNFLAIAAFASAGSDDWMVVGGELLAVLLFLKLVHAAGRVVLPGWQWVMTVAMLGASATQLFIRRAVSPQMSAGVLSAIAAVPVAFQYLAAALAMRRAAHWGAVSRAKSYTLLTILGIVSFTSAAPLALLVYKAHSPGEPAAVLRTLAPVVTLFGLPAVALGLMLWQRVIRQRWAAVRTAGTGVAVAGAAILMYGAALAWPDPSRLLPVCLLNAAAFLAVAMLFRMDPAHALAAIFATAAYLLGFHLACGTIGWSSSPDALLAAFGGVKTGPALLATMVLFAAAAGLFLWLERQTPAIVYAAVAGLVCLLSFVLVSAHGLGRVHDHGATWIYLAYALVALTAGATARQREVAAVGGGLLLLAFVQAICFRFATAFGLTNPLVAWQVALLSYATVGGAVVLAAAIAEQFCVALAACPPVQDRSGRPTVLDTLAGPLAVLAAWASLAAIVPLAIQLSLATVGPCAARTFWIAGLWLLLSLRWNRGEWFVAAQLAMVAGILLTAVRQLAGHWWFAFARHPLAHPFSVQTFGIALALFALAWLALRLATRPILPKLESRDCLGARLLRLAHSQWSAADRLAAFAGLALLVGLSLFAAIPGVREEFAPAGATENVFRGGWLLCLKAADGGSWWLAAAVATCLVATLWERVSRRAVLALILSAGAIAVLSSARWVGYSATATALRWHLAILWVVGSLPLLFPETTRRVAAMLRLVLCQPSTDGLGAMPATVVLSQACLARAGMAGPPSKTTGRRSSHGTPQMMADGALGPRTCGSGLGREGELNATQPSLMQECRALLLLLTVLPVIALTLYRSGVALAGMELTFSRPTCFQSMGGIISYGVPLLLVHVGLIAHAVRQRSSGYAFAAGLVANLAATLTRLLMGHAISRDELVHLAQINAIASASFALAWMAVTFVARRARGREAAGQPALLTLTVAIAAAINIVLIVPGVVRLVADPWRSTDLTRSIADGWGWAALLMAAVAAMAWGRREIGRVAGLGALCISLLTIGAMIAFDFSRDAGNNWPAYHALMLACLLVAWLVPPSDWVFRRIEAPQSPGNAFPGLTRGAILWTVIVGGIAAAMAIRGEVAFDPVRPWWSASSLVALSVLAGLLARVTLDGGYLYASGLLFNAAATIWWLAKHPGWDLPADLANANIIAAAVPSLASVWMARRFHANNPDLGTPNFHRIVPIAPIVATAILVVLGLLIDASGWHIRIMGLPTAWLAVLATGVAIAAGAFDPAPLPTVKRFYALALVALGLLVHGGHLEPHWLGRTIALSLAGFSLLAAMAWAATAAKRQAEAGEIDGATTSGEPPGWLVANTIWQCALVLLLAFRAVLTLDAGPGHLHPVLLRLLGAAAIAMSAAAVAILGHRATRPSLRVLALLLGVLTAVAAAWAILTPGSQGIVINREVALLAAVAAMTAGYSLSLARRAPQGQPWAAAARELMPWLAAAVLGSVLLVISSETWLFAGHGFVDVSPIAIATVILSLAGMVATALVFAVAPGKDPLGMSEAGRSGYVYLAEFFLVLILVHLRLTVPRLFTGFSLQYWPLTILGIAFLGVGLSELCSRRGLRVLAGPLGRTGVFLPVLPVAGFFAVPNAVPFSLDLLLVGLLYGVLAVRRKSFGFGLLAALAGNGGLWYYLHHVNGYGFMQHPQLWLIPFALCVLAAGYLNRDRLNDEQRAGLHYICLMTIYVSSTAEIFINGVVTSPWPPMILAGLSVLGVMVGILLRVRSFLFLGAVFLLLALVSIIWHASVMLAWTWLWYVAGIILGGLIITIFALFEKKRSQVLAVVNGLKEWRA
ncbi:MAG: hypothetical protein PHU85_03710 [Phycisphaerae bacterium]|nr:hypothetical protein [Phycisphaerae bacterium]